MTTHRFSQVDVFADGAFTGNPLAVVHDADSIVAASMQHITRWTNLSEAAFLSAPTHPDADYRVRIFEPKHELPFAGHPTLGACAAWSHAGGVPKRDGVVVQECGAGLIEIRTVDQGFAFAAPSMIRHEPVADEDLERALDVLGLVAGNVIDAHWIDNGPGWIGLLLTDAASVLSIAAPTRQAHDFDVGVFGCHPEGSDVALEVRAFFNDSNGVIREDPVTGSLNASAAQWLVANGTLTAPYIARQRSGRVLIQRFDDTIWVGGATDVRVSGTIEL